MSKSFKSNDLQDSKNQKQEFVFAGNKDFTQDAFNVKENIVIRDEEGNIKEITE